MFDSIIDWFYAFQFTSLMGIVLYWIPLIMCSISYIIETVRDYKHDYKQREIRQTTGSYIPTLKVGTIIVRAFKATIPILNLMCLVFDVFWRYLSFLGSILETTFNQPLVPVRKSNK